MKNIFNPPPGKRYTLLLKKISRSGFRHIFFLFFFFHLAEKYKKEKRLKEVKENVRTNHFSLSVVKSLKLFCFISRETKGETKLGLYQKQNVKMISPRAFCLTNFAVTLPLSFFFLTIYYLK